jgi:hypothetical protein
MHPIARLPAVMSDGENPNPRGFVSVEQSVWKAVYLPTPKHPPNRAAGFGMLAYERNRSTYRLGEAATKTAALPIVECNGLT